MNEQLRPILDELKRRLSEHYGERLERVVLYGSQARGEAAEDSDVDVLVVLRGEVQAGEELWQISGITAELSLRSGQVISTTVLPDRLYRRRPSDFASGIRRDGISL
ncbi:MAG: nucleotidyltransferase domain-containing protein [bacterium]|nr:nucleotidyltransferase domain-containing protein [bacterium]